ncbi:MAG: RNA-dependent DNA polymerase [Chloroflexi bacterium]|nr:RNA-dependent DNA polymerase [Chloroflexota bacterium]
MKRLNHLWPQITSFSNLYLAYKKAKKGKTSRAEVAKFSFDLEKELVQLQQALMDKTYQPGNYRLFTIYERKPRQIAAAPFRDRVVHHALLNVIEPPLDLRMYYHSYACRKEKGVHRAVRQYQTWSKRYRYVMKLDIKKYFHSVDHDILYHTISKYIKDKKVLWLLSLLIKSAPSSREPPFLFPGDDLITLMDRRTGIPIGNLTSQFLANLYLNTLDHFITQHPSKVKYLRYVDDLTLLSDSKSDLWGMHKDIIDLVQKLRLQLHPGKTLLTHTRSGIDLLGYRIFPDFVLLRNDNGWRFKRKLTQYALRYRQGQQWEDFNPSVQSWIGHAKQADTLGLRHSIFYSTIFRRE